MNCDRHSSIINDGMIEYSDTLFLQEQDKQSSDVSLLEIKYKLDKLYSETINYHKVESSRILEILQYDQQIIKELETIKQQNFQLKKALRSISLKRQYKFNSILLISILLVILMVIYFSNLYAVVWCIIVLLFFALSAYLLSTQIPDDI